MLNTQITFERILGTFIPGALFSFGTWYMHRPFLLKYFPNIAGDPAVSSFGGLATEARFLLFIFASLCLGLILNQFADIGIASLFRDDAINEKAKRRARRIARMVWRVVGFTLNQDPRVRAMKRYLESPRKEPFLKMMREWADTDESRLKDADGRINSNEAIAAHQHIVVRLRVWSEASRKTVEDLKFPVDFSASLLMSFVFLFPFSLLSFISAGVVDESVKVQFHQTLFISIAFTYVGIIFSSYLLKRQFKQFCQSILTLALHFHATSNRTVKADVEGNGHKELGTAPSNKSFEQTVS
jgi:hypothetical protein